MSTFGPVSTCHCVNVAMGSYDNAVDMRTPFDLPHRDDRWVCIDTCIATEIGWLWHQGVVTLNSCCGHQKIPPSVIVAEDSYDLMDSLGYHNYKEYPMAKVVPTVSVQNDRGGWVQAIPLPYFISFGRVRCECGEVRRSKRSYREHYALAHVMGLSS